MFPSVLLKSLLLLIPLSIGATAEPLPEFSGHVMASEGRPIDAPAEALGPLELSRIRPYFEGLEKENPCGLEAPYTVQYEKAGRALSFVGADHGPRTLEVVRREFERLRPTVVIVEGMWMANVDRARIETAADECRKRNDCSENLYSVALARVHRVPYVVGETPALEIRDQLLAAGYGKRDVAARFLLGNWDRSLDAEGLPAWFERNFPRIRATYGLDDLSFTLADLESWYGENVTRESPLHRFGGSMTPDSLPPANRLQEMWLAVNRIRNEGLLRKVDAEARKPGARVLVVYGSGHWLETAPALERSWGPHAGLVDASGKARSCGGRGPR